MNVIKKRSDVSDSSVGRLSEAEKVSSMGDQSNKSNSDPSNYEIKLEDGFVDLEKKGNRIEVNLEEIRTREEKGILKKEILPGFSKNRVHYGDIKERNEEDEIQNKSNRENKNHNRTSKISQFASFSQDDEAGRGDDFAFNLHSENRKLPNIPNHIKLPEILAYRPRIDRRIRNHRLYDLKDEIVDRTTDRARITGMSKLERSSQNGYIDLSRAGSKEKEKKISILDRYFGIGK